MQKFSHHNAQREKLIDTTISNTHLVRKLQPILVNKFSMHTHLWALVKYMLKFALYIVEYLK